MRVCQLCLCLLHVHVLLADELAAEIAHPVSEGISCGILVLLLNVSSAVLIKLNDSLQPASMNLIMVATLAAVAIAIAAGVTEVYRRPSNNARAADGGGSAVRMVPDVGDDGCGGDPAYRFAPERVEAWRAHLKAEGYVSAATHPHAYPHALEHIPRRRGCAAIAGTATARAAWSQRH